LAELPPTCDLSSQVDWIEERAPPIEVDEHNRTAGGRQQTRAGANAVAQWFDRTHERHSQFPQLNPCGCETIASSQTLCEKPGSIAQGNSDLKQNQREHH
jgi:hypothetical protein